MSKSTDGQIDQLVKAGWLEIGLSQTDLAEVLGSVSPQALKDGNGTNGIDARRLMQVAEALGIQADFSLSRAAEIRPGKKDPQNLASLQSLLELRLLRVFREVQDHGAKRLLIQLAEQIVKRQASRAGDAG